jgi:hypothetical protein
VIKKVNSLVEQMQHDLLHNGALFISLCR